MKRVTLTLVALLLIGTPRRALAQACCAGASAVTPGRLALHEDALVGLQVQAGTQHGSYDSEAHFHATPPGAAVWDFEQDLLASARLVRRGQATVLLPFLEAWRRAPASAAEVGYGLGDLNLSARYDFTWSREVSYLPGIAALAGITLPTGRAPESARLPLGSDATGLGTVVFTAGVALERAFDRVLVSATLLGAKRLPRNVHGARSELGSELSALGAVSYSLPNDASLALSVNGRFEGPASLDGSNVPGTARRRVRIALAGAMPLSETVRAHGSVFVDPPLDWLGKNESASAGLTMAALWTFP